MEYFNEFLLVIILLLLLFAGYPIYKVIFKIQWYRNISSRQFRIASATIAVLLIVFFLIKLFVDASGGYKPWDIDTNKWYEFAGILGAFLLAGTLLFQIRAFRRQQVEAKFFELVKYYRDNVIQMKLRNPFHHQSHEEQYAEGRRVLKVIFDQYKVARGIIDFDKVIDVENIDKHLMDSNDYSAFFSSQPDHVLSNEQRKVFIDNEIAYLITYWGVSSGTVKEIENWLTKQFKINKKAKDEDDYPELQTELIRKILKCVAFYKCNCKKECQSTYSDSIYNHLKQTEDRSFIECEKSSKKTKFFGGHQYQLGHYFRHLFQAIKFIDRQPSWIFSKKEKYEYAKTLRAQMSNYEQALLFINSLTVLGRNWEYTNKDDRRFISEYHLIKNLPQHFIPDMDPQHYYPDVNFEWKKSCSSTDKRFEQDKATNKNEMKKRIKEEVLGWYKQVSFYRLIFKKYKRTWKIITILLYVLGVLLMIPALFLYAYLSWYIYVPSVVLGIVMIAFSVRYSWLKTQYVIEEYYANTITKGERWNSLTIKRIRRSELLKKMGAWGEDLTYVEYIIDSIERLKNARRYSYPILVNTITSFVSIYFGFVLNSISPTKSTLFHVGGLFILIISVVAFFEIFIVKSYVLSLRNRNDKVLECLEDILEELKFGKK